MATFKIKKSKKGYTLIQTTKNVFTKNKKRMTNLGTFKTKRKAKHEQKLARGLAK